MLITLLALLVALGAASAIPHRRRALARVCLIWFAGLTPLILLIYAIARWEGSTFGSYLALVPAVLTVLCIIDARHGHSHRWARTGPRPRAPSPGQRASA